MTSLEGSLDFYPLDELFSRLRDRGDSGTLVLSREGRDWTLEFADGRVVSARANDPALSAVSIYRRSKKADEDKAERLEELLAATGGKLTYKSVEKKLLDAAMLKELSAQLIREALTEAGSWEGGRFRFKRETIQVDEAAVPEEVELDTLLAEGKKKRQEAEALRKLFPDDSAIFRVHADLDTDKITLSAEQFKVLFRIDGRKSLGEIVKQSGGDRSKVYKVLDALRKDNLIEELSAEEAAEASPARKPKAKPSTEKMPPLPEKELQAERRSSPGVSSQTIVGMPLGGFSAAALTVQDESKNTFPLFDDEYTIGREALNTIQIPDGSISASHARLRRTEQGYEIEDLQSRNGTFVNGEKIDKALLKNDDMVRLGRVMLLYTVAEAAPPSRPTMMGMPKP